MRENHLYDFYTTFYSVNTILLKHFQHLYVNLIISIIILAFKSLLLAMKVLYTQLTYKVTPYKAIRISNEEKSHNVISGVRINPVIEILHQILRSMYSSCFENYKYFFCLKMLFFNLKFRMLLLHVK